MTESLQPFDNSIASENERLLSALQAAGVGTWDYDLTTGEAQWSGICKNLFGLPDDADVSAQLLLDRVHPDDRERVRDANAQALNPDGDGQHDITFRTLTEDGSVRWLQAKGRIIRDDQGRPVRFSGIVQEVTRNLMAEQRLRASEERFRHLIEQAPVATSLYVGGRHVVEVANDVMLDYWGKGRAALGKPILEVLPELAGQPFPELLERVYTTGIAHEEQNARADLVRAGALGTYYFNYTYKPLFDETGAVYGILNMAIDVTDRVLAQRQVEQIQRQAISSFEQAPVAIAIITNPNLTFQMVNPFYASLVGRDLDQLVGKPLLEAMPELTNQGFEQLLEQVIATNVPYVAEEVPVSIRRRGEMEVIYVNFTYQPWQDAGNVAGVLVVATDVTQQVLSRREVEASEAKLRSIIASAPAAMGLFVGRDLIIEIPNQAFIDIVGKGPDIVGKPLREVMPELLTENQPYLQILDDVYTSGKTFQTFGSQVKIVQNGVMTENYYNFTYSPLFDASGEVYAILDIAIDVTEQILTRQAIEHSEARYRELSADLEARVQQRTQSLAEVNSNLTRSNESLEQFAYIASHDLQEPLRKIQSFSSLLRQQYGSTLGEEGMDLLHRMEKAGNRMSLLIRDLLTFSRISNRKALPAPVALRQVVDQALENLSVAIEESGAAIRIDPLPTVAGDASQLVQLFQNLLSNAVKFSRRNRAGQSVVPSIDIYAQAVEPDGLPAPLEPGRLYHRIDVVDNGIGFDEKYTDRIFQVFQRLHGRNEFAGTGVGLAICQKVAANHGGLITAHSQPGRGATFSVYLPA